MNNHYSNNYPIINLYKKASSTKSEIVTQMIYGDRFKIINKTFKMAYNKNQRRWL